MKVKVSYASLANFDSLCALVFIYPPFIEHENHASYVKGIQKQNRKLAL